MRWRRVPAVSTPQIIVLVTLAGLLFWGVGAYNRLVRMRGAIVRRFVPVHEQFRQRQAVLQQQIDVLAAALPDEADAIVTLRAACQQADAACAHARERPGSQQAITSLRLADKIVGDARARLPEYSAPDNDLTALNTQLGAADATLAFARRQFNEAATDYNVAVRQFPTSLLVGLFGFRVAGTL